MRQYLIGSNFLIIERILKDKVKNLQTFDLIHH